MRQPAELVGVKSGKGKNIEVIQSSENNNYNNKYKAYLK